jgi:hypothetical protein
MTSWRRAQRRFALLYLGGSALGELGDQLLGEQLGERDDEGRLIEDNHEGKQAARQAELVRVVDGANMGLNMGTNAGTNTGRNAGTPTGVPSHDKVTAQQIDNLTSPQASAQASVAFAEARLSLARRVRSVRMAIDILQNRLSFLDIVEKGRERGLPLPVSHVCFNKLDLPAYNSPEVLKEKLFMAVRGSGNAILLE